MFRKITACAAALTLTMFPSIQANAEDQTIKVNINGQENSLSLNATEGKEDEREILGDAWYYGVVADKFIFNGESETSFAVKSLQHLNADGGGQTGVTDKGKGSKKAFFMAGSVDSPFMIKGIDAEVITPESEKEKFRNSTQSGNPVTFTPAAAEDINAYIDALENDITVQSQRLSTMDSITDYTALSDEGKITLDITSAGDNTVYINVDKWEGLKKQLRQSGGVTLVKNAGQKAVFSFPSDAEVTLQKMTVSTDGKDEDTTGLANRSTTSGSTAADLIFNMPSATDVSLNDSTGIFLAPKASVTSGGVDGGWLVADTFTNGCEWHFINGELPEEITERKTMITPKEEGSVLGARRAKPAVTPKTEEEKSSETPQPEEKEEKPDETPSATPVTKPETEKQPSVPAPAATPVTTPKTPDQPALAVTPSSTSETTAAPTPETTQPEEKTVSVPKNTKKPEKVSSPAPSSIPATPSASEKPSEKEKTASSGKSVEKKENRTAETKTVQPEEKKTEKVMRAPKKNAGVYPVHSVKSAKEIKEAVPVEKNTKALRTETPDTADHSDMNIYSALLIGAGILMIGVIRRMRKERESE